MSVQHATLKVGATISATGGTDRTYAVTGKAVTNGVHIVDINANNALLASHAYVVSKDGGNRSDGGRLLSQRSCRFVKPKQDSLTKTVYPSIEVILKPHAESTVAEIEELKNLAVLALISSDFTNLFQIGALS